MTPLMEGSRSAAAHDRPSISETETLAEDRWSHHRGIPTASAWSLLLSSTKSHNREMEQLKRAVLLVDNFSVQFLSLETTYTLMVTPRYRDQFECIQGRGAADSCRSQRYLKCPSCRDSCSVNCKRMST